MGIAPFGTDTMTPFSRHYLAISAVSGALAVGFGAFAAHALKHRLDDYATGIWSTANDYHFIHTLALGLVVVLGMKSASRSLSWAARLFTAGLLVFSGSLYALALSGEKWLGAITPIGGVAFILGWLAILVYAFKSKAE